MFAYYHFVDQQQKSGGLLIAASIVAAIRLRGQEIKPSPKLTATIRDSVRLAQLVLAEIERKAWAKKQT
jgi:hypothetical protein